MLTRILPARTWAMTQVGDIVSTFNGDVRVEDVKNSRQGDRLVHLSNGITISAWDNNSRITIRRPLAKTRPSGVTLADCVSVESVVNAAIARKAVEGR